jgi:hypothetical protein
VYAQDGSFTGNLNSEVGGSYKLYNLGTDGDADTEYLGLSWSGNVGKIQVLQTGTGTERRLDIEASGIRFKESGTVIADVDAGALRLYTGSIRPLTDGVASAGTSSIRFSDVFSVDGDFSGDVTIGGYVLGGSSGHAINLSQGLVGESQLRVASGGVAVLAWGYNGSNYAYIASDFFPSVDGSYSSGLSTQRWSNVFSVDGSFGGNLNSEVGGSIRQYGLGTESDTDTEFLNIAWDTNTYYIEPKQTGSGANRNLYLRAGNRAAGVNIKTNAAEMVASTAVVLLTASSFSTNRLFVPTTNGTIDCGTTSNRWSSVYSVDGSFSGTLDTEVGGSNRIFNLGSDADVAAGDTEFGTTEFSSNVLRFGTKTTGSGVARDVGLIRNGQYKLYIGSSEATIYQQLVPFADASYSLGKVGRAWSNVYSVAGNFSGTITNTATAGWAATFDRAIRVGADSGVNWFYSSGNNSKFSTPVTFESSFQFARAADGINSRLYRYSKDASVFACRPVDSGVTGATIFQVEDATDTFQPLRTGGIVNHYPDNSGAQSYRMYNLGESGDADTEYLELSWATNKAYLTVTETGTGIGRDLVIDSGSSVRFSYNGNERIILSNTEFRPVIDNYTSFGTATTRYSDVFSVDGDFSGTVTANTITSSGANLTLQRNSLDAIAIGGTFIQCYHEIRPSITSIYSNGTETLRWSKTYSVDGSFTGTLDTEVGGSMRLFNLGSDADVAAGDTEYGYVQMDAGTLKIGVDATGTGSTVKPVNFYTDSSFGFKATGGSTRFNITSSDVVTYLNFKPSNDGTKNSGSITNYWARTFSNAVFNNIETITAATDSLVTTDTTLLCDCTSNDISLTIPTSSSDYSGNRYEIKKIDSSANTVTITPTSRTIDGAATATITTQYESITIVSDGTNWFIVN